MRAELAITCLAVATTVACDPGPAPLSGTYALEVSGTKTVYAFDGDTGTTEDIVVDTTMAVYVDEGPNGGDIGFTFASMGLAAPNKGRLMEARIFPSAFDIDTGTNTLAGVFLDDSVEGLGQAYAGGSNYSLQFPDLEEATFCAAYERYRLTYLAGTWTDAGWDVELDAGFNETCVLSDGSTFRAGFPQTVYVLSGQAVPMYELAPDEAEAEAAARGTLQ